MISVYKRTHSPLYLLGEKLFRTPAVLMHPPHSCAAKFGHVLLYSPNLLENVFSCNTDLQTTNKFTVSNKTSLPQERQKTKICVLLINP